MPNPVVLRTKKLKTLGHVAASGAHTWREIDTPNADPLRTPANQDLRPARDSGALVEAVKDRLKLATEQAENPVVCIEYLVTADHAAFSINGGPVDHDRYLRDALAWIEAKHGRDNVVAANIQLDERTPHLVAYVVPLVDVPGKTRKRSVIAGTNPDGTKRRETREFPGKPVTRLSAAHYVGSPMLLGQMQTDFAAQVGEPHGLRRGVKGSKATHRTIREHYAALSKAAVTELATPAELRLAATTAVQEQRRAREMAATAIELQQQLAALADIPAEEIREAVIERRMQRRVDRLSELVERATGALASLCRRALDAIALAGDWRRVGTEGWNDLHRAVIQDVLGSGGSVVEAVETIHEHSPGAVQATPKDLDEDLDWAHEQELASLRSP